MTAVKKAAATKTAAKKIPAKTTAKKAPATTSEVRQAESEVRQAASPTVDTSDPVAKKAAAKVDNRTWQQIAPNMIQQVKNVSD